MDRLISEQAVLEAVDKVCCGSIEYRVIYDRCEEQIKAISSAEPKWIPVSERLPENHSRVLTTIQVPGREPHVRSGLYFNGLFSNDNGDVWKATDEEVKAWMPSPEPYEPQEGASR